MFSPSGVAIDGAGNLFIADTKNNRIRRVDATSGIITTVAGNGDFNLSGDGGPAASASLASPTGVAIDGAWDLFIADYDNNVIRVVKGIAKGQGGGQRQVTITGSSFKKPIFTISGSGFTAFGANVRANGQDISKSITNQTDAQITLKGSTKKLNLKKGPNQITVTSSGATSNTFVLNLFAADDD